LAEKKKLKHLDGKTININIPEGTESEKILRLRNLGFTKKLRKGRLVCENPCDGSKRSEQRRKRIV
jgi:DnaJ-class molecular chaperone